MPSACYAMAKRGTLKVPVIGVAYPKWNLERLRKRVTDSIKRSGGIEKPCGRDLASAPERYLFEERPGEEAPRRLGGGGS